MTCNPHTSPANSSATKELQPCGRHQGGPHVAGHDATGVTLSAVPGRQESPTCDPDPPHANVQATRRVRHTLSLGHVPFPAVDPKLGHQLLPPTQHESAATVRHPPLQHSQHHLQRQPVPYPGAYSVHLAQHWPALVHAQSAARTPTTVQATAPTDGSMTVTTAATTNWHDLS